MNITYRFVHDSGRTQVFSCDLDDVTLDLVVSDARDLPDWSRLSFEKCAECPLDASTEFCPAAAAISDVAEESGDAVSHHLVDVHVEFGGRDYHARTSIQSGASSFLGVLMATSG